jgi:hypothetical protein
MHILNGPMYVSSVRRRLQLSRRSLAKLTRCARGTLPMPVGEPSFDAFNTRRNVQGALPAAYHHTDCCLSTVSDPSLLRSGIAVGTIYGSLVALHLLSVFRLQRLERSVASRVLQLLASRDVGTRLDIETYFVFSLFDRYCSLNHSPTRR